MPWSISKDFAFSASHVLTGLRDGHPCGRLHGHNYTVRVTVEADDLDATGFIIDYGDLAPFSHYLDETFDHRHLNEVMDINPTAEHLARWLHGDLLTLMWLPPGAHLAVSVSETPKTWATWRD